jgi:hypothetical protein
MKRFTTALICLCACLLYWAGTGKAQHPQSIWCITDSLSLNLQDSIPQIGFSKSIYGFNEASWVENGNLLLYLRPGHLSIWPTAWFLNGNHQEIENSQIPGEQTWKYPFILPASNNRYLFLTRDVQDQGNPPDNMNYSIIDMNANGGSGKMTDKLVLFYPVQYLNSGMSACKHADGKRYWILAHEGNSNNFIKFIFDGDSIYFHSIQSIGRVYSYTNRFVGELNFSYNGSKIVCSHGNGILQIFDFNRCSGELLNFQDLSRNIFSITGRFYSAVFSRDNKYIYSTSVDTLYQYQVNQNNYLKNIIWEDTFNIQKNTIISIKYDFDNNKLLITNSSGFGSTAISALPLDNYFMGVIHQPDSFGVLCKYEKRGLYLNGKQSPAWLSPSINYNLGALGTAYAWPLYGPKEPPPICAGDSVRLGEWFSEPGISYQWAPAAGLSCTTCFAPKAAPAQTTVYTLYTTSTNACGLTADTATVTVTILQPPSQVVINLGSDRTICAGDSLTIGVVPVQNVAYSWNTDATTPGIGIRPEQTTTYILQAVDTSASCGEPVPAIDSIKVTVLPADPLFLALPADTAVCPGESLTLTPQVSGSGSYLWSTGDTGPTLTVSPDQTTTYSLTLSGNDCQTPVSASVTVTVLDAQSSPCVTARRRADAVSYLRVYPNPADREFTLELTRSGEYTLVSATGEVVRKSALQVGRTTESLLGIPAGTYFIRLVPHDAGFLPVVQKLVIKR